MKIRLSVKRNLMVVLEFDTRLQLTVGSIISYSTNVATIKDKKILVNGKYSRTTSKHLSHIACLTHFPIQMMNKSNKMDWWYEYGANISHPESLSPGTSHQLLESLRETESLVFMSVNLKPSLKRDERMVNEILENADVMSLIDSTRAIIKSFALG